MSASDSTEGAPKHEESAGTGWFKTTQWSAVLDAVEGNTTQADAGLERLCCSYWLPIYTFIRRSGRSPEDAKDLTQAFFARVVEKDYLKALKPERGKFRTFLLMVLQRFLANERERANAQKRGGGQAFLSLDGLDTEACYQRELADEVTPEKAFDRRWAMTLLEKVQHRLNKEMAAEGKTKEAEELQVFLTGEKNDRSYAEVAQRLDISEGTLRVTVHRLRRRYRELLRLEIADTVASPEAIDDEIRHLFAALG